MKKAIYIVFAVLVAFTAVSSGAHAYLDKPELIYGDERRHEDRLEGYEADTLKTRIFGIDRLASVPRITCENLLQQNGARIRNLERQVEELACVKNCLRDGRESMECEFSCTHGDIDGDGIIVPDTQESR